VLVAGSTATNNRIEGNYIGTDKDGATALKNGSYGVLFSGVSGNTIGGTAAEAGNVIRGNGSAGVYVASGTRNAILANRIYGNGGLGIDLSPSGRTANDLGDGDAGSNNLQNYPVIAQAVVAGGTTTITGTLNSEPNKTYRLEFFANTAADPSGYGEGETYLESISVTTDASGNASFTLPYSGDLTGQKITATATELVGGSTPGSTSEFSQAVSATIASMGLTSPNIAQASASARPSVPASQPTAAAIDHLLATEASSSHRTSPASLSAQRSTALWIAPATTPRPAIDAAFSDDDPFGLDGWNE